MKFGPLMPKIGGRRGRGAGGPVRRRALASACGLLGLALAARGQSLRFGYGAQLTPPAPRFGEGTRFGWEIPYRAIQKTPPDYAFLRIGPFYSSAVFTQTAGYRYTRSRGTGTDYLFDNRRGVIKEDGSEFPLVSMLDLRNYLLITRNMDLDLSVGLRYAHYPLGTQDDEFYVAVAEEGVFGTLSAAVDWTPFVRSIFYDVVTYRTDYIDTRGLRDIYGGEKYEYFSNELGANSDWQLAKDKDILFNLAREDVIPRDEEFADQERITYREGVGYEQAIVQGLVAGARANYAQTDYRAPERPDTRTQEYSIYARFGGDVGLREGDEHGLRMWLTELSTLEVGLGYYAGISGAVTAERTEEEERLEVGDADVAGVSGFATLRTQLRRDLRHELGYRRGVRGGFRTAFEEYETYGYRLWWDGELTRATAYTMWSNVKPSSEAYNEYRDWTSGVEVSYPLIEYITLLFSSTYQVRENRGRPADPEADVELVSDYTTWDTRVGTSFGIMREVRFVTYYEHTERWSESDDLEYTRDTFEATLVYSHVF